MRDVQKTLPTPPGEIAAHLDVLSEVLSTRRLTGATFFSAEFREPWGFTSPPLDTVAKTLQDPDAHVSNSMVIFEGQNGMPGTDNLELRARTYKKTMFAAPNLSTSQLNCVGLSVYLACATRGGTPFTTLLRRWVCWRDREGLPSSTGRLDSRITERASASDGVLRPPSRAS